MNKLLKLLLLQGMIIFGMTALPCQADPISNPPDPIHASDALETVRSNGGFGKDIEIIRFNITPARLIAGQTARLTWQVNGADRVYIDDHNQLEHAEVSPSGHLSIIPMETTSYILTAYDQQMLAASAVATIEVTGQPPPPRLSLSVTPESISAGEGAMIRWKVQYADAISIDNGIGAVGRYGAIKIKPVHTTTYLISATGLGGTSMASITILVIPARAAKTGDQLAQ